MAFDLITAADTAGKGNIGLPDTPGLSTEAMQRKLDELSLDVLVPHLNALIAALTAESAASDIGAAGGTVQSVLDALTSGKAEADALVALTERMGAAEQGKADRDEVLRIGAGEAYTPAGPYDPATRRYVDETVIAVGAGDMARATYDPDGDGVVDDAAALGGRPAASYATAEALQAVSERAEAAHTAAAGAMQKTDTAADSRKLGGQDAAYYAAAQHAAGDTSHGAGSGSLFGHVKLSDSVAETLTTADGTAATPKAVKAAYDRAGTAVTQAAAAQTTADAAMPKSGGTFTGEIVASGTVSSLTALRNIRVQNSSSETMSTGFVILQRK